MDTLYKTHKYCIVLLILACSKCIVECTIIAMNMSLNACRYAFKNSVIRMHKELISSVYLKCMMIVGVEGKRCELARNV